ncbi:MAG: peptidyl-alpha-hydroxyglycine alpha-amidating lyase family protein [Verrucomicrobiota bacterium]
MPPISRRSLLRTALSATFLSPLRSVAIDASPEPFILDPLWPQLTSEFYPKPCQISGIAIAKDGALLVLNRGENSWNSATGFEKHLVQKPTVLVVDPVTAKITSVWGENTFVLPHQIDVDPLGHIWISDVGRNTITKFDTQGQKVLELGGPDIGFKKPTATGFLSDGSVVISDGYENSRIVKFSAEGKSVSSWGTKGSGPVQFKIPHGISVDDEDRIYVADRENRRVQVLDANGGLLAIWTNVEQAVSIRYAGGSIYVLSNLVAVKGTVRRLNKQGEILESFQTFPKSGWEGFETPHGLAVGDNGETIYVGFVTGKRIQRYRRNN